MQLPAHMENVLPEIQRWRAQGLAGVLVTLVAIDGSSPRRLGAQMAVSAAGQSAGSITGGCLEAAILAEAKAVLAERKNRCVRYGKGSRYIDIRLPCGSGLDLYFDQGLRDELLDQAVAHQARRLPFALRTDLATGDSELVPLAPGDEPPVSALEAEKAFVRCYQPTPRLLIAGAEPMTACVAGLARTLGLGVEVLTPEIAASRPALDIDRWTAAVLLFHEHEKELELLQALLRSDGFYIGAMGSTKTQQSRLDTLAALGHGPEQLQRIRGPVGLIPGAKTPNELAISVLAQVISEAMNRGMAV
jgi:xanthine dehydrogenase accessory factor